MRNIRYFILMSTAFLLIACGNEEDECKYIETEEDLENCNIYTDSILEQFRVPDSEIGYYANDEDPSFIPLRTNINGMLYDIIDKNKDLKVDEYIVSDYAGNILIVKVDDDFNGFFETSITYVGDIVSGIYVDSNENGINDIVDEIKFGVVFSSEQYYESGHIGKFEYKFGYPVGNELLTRTDMTEEAFEVSRNAKLETDYELPEKYKVLK
ncbi:MAG: hypothetical protein OEY19_03075 [Gammaproteobacteria bacterium]|nr:hypothetical protein [Gammaproteobacteria bacterium]MDH5631324.1 hypothetical protein [Gammaproteobacteria bacterium]